MWEVFVFPKNLNNESSPKTKNEVIIKHFLP